MLGHALYREFNASLETTCEILALNPIPRTSEYDCPGRTEGITVVIRCLGLDNCCILLHFVCECHGWTVSAT